MPVGTAARLAELVARKVPGGLLAWNPEFLREGFAVQDTLHPDRLVYGLPAGDDGETARALLDEVYRPIVDRGTPQVITDYATAEMVKTAANSFLATKISFTCPSVPDGHEIADLAGGASRATLNRRCGTPGPRLQTLSASRRSRPTG